MLSYAATACILCIALFNSSTRPSSRPALSLLSLQAEVERHKQQQRQAALQRAGQHSSRPLAALHKLWLRGTSTATDHLRNLIILAVFGFKVLEWWYTSAEDRLASGSALPPPPAPPAPTPHPNGVKLAADVKICPLCR